MPGDLTKLEAAICPYDPGVVAFAIVAVLVVGFVFGFFACMVLASVSEEYPDNAFDAGPHASPQTREPSKR